MIQAPKIFVQSPAEDVPARPPFSIYAWYVTGHPSTNTVCMLYRGNRYMVKSRETDMSLFLINFYEFQKL